jgi:hypothetical protein
MNEITEQYKEVCTEAMCEFLIKKDVDLLTSKLRMIDNEHKVKIGVEPHSPMSIWFRFFGSDTAATTIKDIKTDLSLSTNAPNYKNMIENIIIGVDGECLRVFFS